MQIQHATDLHQQAQKYNSQLQEYNTKLQADVRSASSQLQSLQVLNTLSIGEP